MSKAPTKAQREYTAWIQKQISCITGGTDWIEEIGEGRCEAAHVNRVAYGAGRGFKGDLLVPLTHEEHHYYHQHGEQSVLLKYLEMPKLAITEEFAKCWFENAAFAHKARYERGEPKRKAVMICATA